MTRAVSTELGYLSCN